MHQSDNDDGLLGKAAARIKELEAQLTEAEKYGADMERYVEYLLGVNRDLRRQLEEETKVQ